MSRPRSRPTSGRGRAYLALLLPARNRFRVQLIQLIHSLVTRGACAARVPPSSPFLEWLAKDDGGLGIARFPRDRAVLECCRLGAVGGVCLVASWQTELAVHPA